jgi:hypothetical protein
MEYIFQKGASVERKMVKLSKSKGIVEKEKG